MDSQAGGLGGDQKPGTGLEPDDRIGAVGRGRGGKSFRADRTTTQGRANVGYHGLQIGDGAQSGTPFPAPNNSSDAASYYRMGRTYPEQSDSPVR